MRGLILFCIIFYLLISFNPCEAAIGDIFDKNLQCSNELTEISGKEVLVKYKSAKKQVKQKMTQEQVLNQDLNSALNAKDYERAIFITNQLIETNKLSDKDYEVKNLQYQKNLSYYYSKLNDLDKSISIIEKLLEKDTNNPDLLNWIIAYSMMNRDWDNSIVYIERALKLNPNSEDLLSTQADLYVIKQDYSAAISLYEKLIQLYPKDEYKFALADLYKASNDFEHAESVILPMYAERPTDKGVLTVYTDILLAQDKSQQAYEIIKKYGLEKTMEGLRAQADIAMKEKKYDQARGFYAEALSKDANNEVLKIRLATSYRKQKKYKEAEEILNEVLSKNPNSLGAKVALAYISMDKKKFGEAQDLFRQIMKQCPDCKEAEMGIVYTYILDNQTMKALDLLKQMPADNNVNFTKATLYSSLGMFSDAKDILQGTVHRGKKDLYSDIQESRAFTVTPSYTFFNQELSENYDLDLRKVGLDVSQYGAKNIKGFLDYGLYCYISGNYNDNHYTNVTNEFRGGIQGRPSEKIEFRTDLGVKAFQFNGAMLNTDSWIKYYVNDSFNYKIGFKRNNTEQSYLAAVGTYINNVFTGRIAENKVYCEFDGRLPNRYYYFGRMDGGVYTAQNLPNNNFMEGLIGFGRVLYNNPENKWIKFISADVVSYNASYQNNMINISNGNGGTFGGYFSPSFYSANTVNFKIEGENKKWHLKYGLKGFVGGQAEFTPNEFSAVYGIFPYISCDVNNHVAVNLSYSFSDYSGIQRHLAVISVNIKLFRKKK